MKYVPKVTDSDPHVTHALVGDCHWHGITDGEATHDLKERATTIYIR